MPLWLLRGVLPSSKLAAGWYFFRFLSVMAQVPLPDYTSHIQKYSHYPSSSQPGLDSGLATGTFHSGIFFTIAGTGVPQIEYPVGTENGGLGGRAPRLKSWCSFLLAVQFPCQLGSSHRDGCCPGLYLGFITEEGWLIFYQVIELLPSSLVLQSHELSAHPYPHININLGAQDWAQGGHMQGKCLICSIWPKVTSCKILMIHHWFVIPFKL